VDVCSNRISIMLVSQPVSVIVALYESYVHDLQVPRFTLQHQSVLRGYGLVSQCHSQLINVTG
jgi:hypothetical protein